MITNNYPQITFGAKFINHATINKLDSVTNKYTPKKVSFAEFDPKNDYAALDSGVRRYWGYEYISDEILKEAELLHYGDLDSKEHKVYILTEQNGNLKKLAPDKIIGLAKINEIFPGEIFINWFQVRPDIAFKKTSENSPRSIEHVGKAIINSLKNIYQKSIRLSSTFNAANFYEKHGFEITDLEKMMYIWKGNK